MAPRRDRFCCVAAAAVVLTSGACTGAGRPPPVSATGPAPTALVTPTRSPTAPPRTTSVAELPVHPVGWLPCGSGLECGLVAAPLDYSHPAARTIGIAVERHPATDPAHRIGSLIINPGGPGGSGIDDLPTELRVLTPDLIARFDIVSFDPRGVGRSAPIHCHPGGAAAAPASPGPLPDPVPQTDADRQALLDANRTYGRACQRNSGDLLPFVGTVDTARDLDRIREALGDQRLTFFGHSYGTLLGATYADMFPNRVRAMVLDGAIDPSLSLDDMSLDQAEGFDASLRAFFASCQSSAGCGWRAGADPGASFQALLARVRAYRLPGGGGRTVGPGELYLGVLSTLYARSFWPALGRALGAAQRGDGSQLLALSDGYQGHSSSNAGDANAAITCLDHPTSPDLATHARTAALAASRAPVFGPVFAWGALECAAWPVPPTRQPHRATALGSPPILVVGTTSDPATPYAWAMSLASGLSRGVLVGRVGIDHVAYYYSACVRTIDARYLIDGAVPATGMMCSS